MNIADIRKDYKLKSLNEADVAENPIAQFTFWWNEAIESKIEEVNAMTLSTVTNTGIPSSRIVLLKGYDENGFVFFTNYNSKKGQQIAENPNVSLLFFWKELERQVHIQGSIEKITAAESDAYFFSRPLGSRIGAWSSPQSNIIEGRHVLEQNEAYYKLQFGNDIPRPAHWGGYIVRPTSVEFWQGRSSRLHDRIIYQQSTTKDWQVNRLAP